MHATNWEREQKCLSVCSGDSKGICSLSKTQALVASFPGLECYLECLGKKKNKKNGPSLKVSMP